MNLKLERHCRLLQIRKRGLPDIPQVCVSTDDKADAVRCNVLLAFAPILIIAVFLAGVALAGTTISARYLQPRGDHIVWEIDVPSPPPAAVIVTQYILPGSEIVASSHPLSSYDKEGGVAKWLIAALAPGTLKMEMTVSKPIRKKGEIHGEVMFQDESQNTTATLFMRPARAVKKKLEGC